eukprot:3679175-Heterocapsa_arctica.AAC.1
MAARTPGRARSAIAAGTCAPSAAATCRTATPASTPTGERHGQSARLRRLPLARRCGRPWPRKAWVR